MISIQQQYSILHWHNFGCSHNLHKVPCGEIKTAKEATKHAKHMKNAYKMVLNFLVYSKDMHKEISAYKDKKKKYLCDNLPLIPGILAALCKLANWMWVELDHVIRVIFITTIHLMKHLQAELGEEKSFLCARCRDIGAHSLFLPIIASRLAGTDAASELKEYATFRDEMMYNNFLVVMDKLAELQSSQSPDASSDRRLETTTGVERNLELDKIDAVVTAIVSAEVKTAIEAQQTENKAQMTEIKAQQNEIKAEIKAQQTESNQKLNSLEAMVAQLIEQNKQLLGSIEAGKEEEE